jgi:hypothetical protein
MRDYVATGEYVSLHELPSTVPERPAAAKPRLRRRTKVLAIHDRQDAGTVSCRPDPVAASFNHRPVRRETVRSPESARRLKRSPAVARTVGE